MELLFLRDICIRGNGTLKPRPLSKVNDDQICDEFWRVSQTINIQ